MSRTFGVYDGDSIKIPIAQSVNTMATARANDQISLLGKSYPCTVAEVVSSGIVIVNFELNSAPQTLPKITVPVIGSQYYRLPIQVGDKGFVVSATALLGNITGLGSGGPPDLTQPGNLGALAFHWLGNTEWPEPIDPAAAEVNGPNGANIYDEGKNCILAVSPSGATISGPSGDLTVTGNLSAGNGITCSFTTPTGQTVTVQNGIITNLV